jgi:endonuclease/exonuclease/phosphatase family metal-dependent hydrolase
MWVSGITTGNSRTMIDSLRSIRDSLCARFAGLCVLLFAATLARADVPLSVMSFNAWGAGLNEGKPIDETVAAIRASGADIVALLETRAEAPICGKVCPPVGPDVAPQVAAALGFRYHEQRGAAELQWASAVLSRYPIVAELSDGLGAEIDVRGQRVQVYTVHLPDWPYQPFQLLGIEYDGAPRLHDARAAVASAKATRGPGLERLRAAIASAAPAAAVFICGDFNEPSHRDWTPATVAAGLHPTAVQWPTIAALESAGFVDTWRAVHPDPVAHPGFTWSARSAPDDPTDHHDRIDFVLVAGSGVTIESSALVGEVAPPADVVITPWPSDHRAVLTRVRLPAVRGTPIVDELGADPGTRATRARRATDPG